MSRRSIDMHAHIEPSISKQDLIDLNALVFAATRTLQEANEAAARSDDWTIWGVGCHPGLVGAQKAFDPERFSSLIQRTPFVSEVGLDGSSRVPLELQLETFNAVLRAMLRTPRISSIHSYGATDRVLDALEAIPVRSPVLHWWLGDDRQTTRAIELGCYFSVNPAMARKHDILSALPMDRILTETDHPFGDRTAGRARRPGNVDEAERAIASVHKLGVDAIRAQVWKNLGNVVSDTKTGLLFPRAVRLELLAA